VNKMEIKKLLDKILPTTISSIAVWLIIISLGTFGTVVSTSFKKVRQVDKNTKITKELVRAVEILSRNDSIIIHGLDKKVDFEVYEKGISMYRNVQDSSLLVLNNMNLSNLHFYEKMVELFEQQKYYNRQMLKYAKDQTSL